MTKAMKAIVQAGVRLLDIRTQNFLVIPETRFVVAVDFAMADFGYKLEENRAYEVKEVCKQFIREYGEFEDPVQDWIFANLPEDVRVFSHRRAYRSSNGLQRY